jgi:hypothetical protein
LIRSLAGAMWVDIVAVGQDRVCEDKAAIRKTRSRHAQRRKTGDDAIVCGGGMMESLTGEVDD